VAKYAEDIIVDKKDQMEKIAGVCLPDEIIRSFPAQRRWQAIDGIAGTVAACGEDSIGLE